MPAPDDDQPPPGLPPDAARHAMNQDGLAAATLERISAATGISRMTLHRRGVPRRGILQCVLTERTAPDMRADGREF